jgi:uncharacterized membrane protein YeaQ/YmgE (transglycosylase-associated protein family)
MPRGTQNGYTKERPRMIGFILYLLIIGVIAGFLARLLVPGRDPMTVGATIVLGVVGSFIGGFLGWALFGHDLADGALQPSGVFGSIVGAVIALLVYRAVTRRSSYGRV